MKIPLYQVDAFTDQLFSGNPAAVCPLDRWLSDHLMQNIAAENNLAETVFFVKNDDVYEIRWFSPTVEVDLCGHATLAASYILFNVLENGQKVVEDQIRFVSPRSGPLTVSRDGELLTLNFPTDSFRETVLDELLTGGFNIRPVEAFKGKTDYMLVYENEDQIRQLKPDFAKIARIKARGVIVTAPGNDVDFVSRFFGPQTGINEDPVTGSAHTTLTPYWYRRTGKKTLSALQLSQRQGSLTCTYDEDRVLISGNARLYLSGEIEVR